MQDLPKNQCYIKVICLSHHLPTISVCGGVYFCRDPAPACAFLFYCVWDVSERLQGVKLRLYNNHTHLNRAERQEDRIKCAPSSQTIIIFTIIHRFMLLNTAPSLYSRSLLSTAALSKISRKCAISQFAVYQS